MRNFKTVCLVIIASVAVIGSVLSAFYASQLSAYVEQLERSARADMIYLRGYIRRLEGELTEAIANLSEETSFPTNTDQISDTETEAESVLETERSDLPTDGHPEDDSASPETETEFNFESEAETETESEAESESESESESETDAEDESDTEFESETDAEDESDTEFESETEIEPEPEKPILYTLTIYNGRIGVFDATGRILCTLNVFVPSLPASDYAALLAGIPIYSQEQMWEIWDKYA